MSCFDILRGERINGMSLGDDGWALVFSTVTGKHFHFKTTNDCCNSVWFNHITGVDILGKGNSFDLLRGALVNQVEEKGWNDNREGDEDYDVVQEAFWTIHTDRGYIDIEVRNSHNGYYGGRVEHVEGTDHIPGIPDLTQIFEDF